MKIKNLFDSRDDKSTLLVCNTTVRRSNLLEPEKSWLLFHLQKFWRKFSFRFAFDFRSNSFRIIIKIIFKSLTFAKTLI